jgi:hypothetical protein
VPGGYPGGESHCRIQPIPSGLHEGLQYTRGYPEKSQRSERERQPVVFIVESYQRAGSCDDATNGGNFGGLSILPVVRQKKSALTFKDRRNLFD